MRAGEDPVDWGIEFGDLTVAVRVVGSLDEAVAHINRHGSRHTDAIVTEDESARDRFFARVRAEAMDDPTEPGCSEVVPDDWTAGRREAAPDPGPG